MHEGSAALRPDLRRCAPARTWGSARASGGTYHFDGGTGYELVMRGLNGRETAELVRELKPDVAVLYMSGYTDDGVFRRGVLEQGTAFLQKPFGANDLLRKIRDVLDGRHAAPLAPQ